jgi:hypothetical protein
LLYDRALGLSGSTLSIISITDGMPLASASLYLQSSAKIPMRPALQTGIAAMSAAVKELLPR